MPDAARAVNGCPPGSSQNGPVALVLTSTDGVSTHKRQRACAHRSSSRPTPDPILSSLFPRRSPQRSSANAAVGGLKPPPRRATPEGQQPPSLLQHRSQRDHHLPNRPTSCVRVHNRPAPDAVQPRLFPRRSTQRSSANAPVGGLAPAPVGRRWRAKQPPSLLQLRSQRDHHLTICPTSYVHVHNSTTVFSQCTCRWFEASPS